MRERTISTQKTTCHDCGRKWYVIYDEAGKIYCPACALKYGAIDSEEFRYDCDDDFTVGDFKANKKPPETRQEF